MGGSEQQREAGFDESAEDLLENAPCGYLSAAPDGTLVRVNATFLRWTGYRRDELVGVKRFQDLLTVGGRIYHETHYAPMLQMQGTVREIAVEIVGERGAAAGARELRPRARQPGRAAAGADDGL
jgi:PAS domain S-box-containing protein